MVRLSLLLLVATQLLPSRPAPETLPFSDTSRLVSPGGLLQALEEAHPGNTLVLLPGIHSGPVTISKRLRLVGREGAILDGNGQGTVLTLVADGVEVVGLTVRGSGSDLSKDDSVVLLDHTHGITIRRCHIEARAFGIYLKAGGRHHIIENRVRGDTSLPQARRGNGIHLWHSIKNEVRDNELADVRDGLYLSFAHRNMIRGNHGNHLRYGIHYMYSEHNVLVENHFDSSTGGIALMFSLGNRIERNRTFRNQNFGILCLQLERSTLAGNQVSQNGRGLYLENSAGNRFESNRLEGNGVGVYLTAGSEKNVFSGNRFDGNLVQVYRKHAGANRWFDDGRGNFWSDYVGFDWDGDGVGETPYRLETAVSALLARRPAARWLWMSPVLALLDWWQAHGLVPGKHTLDPYPLVTPMETAGGAAGKAESLGLN